MTPKKKVNYYYFEGFYSKKFFFKVDANLDLTELFDCYNNNEIADDDVQEIVEQDEEIEVNEDEDRDEGEDNEEDEYEYGFEGEIGDEEEEIFINENGKFFKF